MRYIDWLPGAYEAALGFRASGTGRSNIYLVLLDYRDRGEGTYGVYVGMSKYSPAQRFDQHKAGIRAAGSVLKRGLEVLTGPTLHLQFIKRADAARIEIELARSPGGDRAHRQGRTLTLAGTIHELQEIAQKAGSGGYFPEREKQDVFHAAPRDGFTAVRKISTRSGPRPRGQLSFMNSPG